MTRTGAEVVGLTKRHGRRLALSDLTLRAGVGVTGLLGPNGAGKTTLLRILGTVSSPDAGSVCLLGRDPSRGEDRVAIRRHLGYLPQEFGFYRSFSVIDFLDYVAILKQIHPREARQDEVSRVIEEVDLVADAQRRIRTLSGGARRRVGLAQALLGDPQLLVLDEPTAGLDPEQRLRFRDLISRLGERRTVVLSTHQTDDIAALCHQVVVLDGGRLRFCGTPRELLARVQDQVWTSPTRTASADVSWRTGDGTFHDLGSAPAAAGTVPPTLNDAYLLLLESGRHPR